jgi:hypothetical protein
MGTTFSTTHSGCSTIQDATNVETPEEKEILIAAMAE